MKKKTGGLNQIYKDFEKYLRNRNKEISKENKYREYWRPITSKRDLHREAHDFYRTYC